MKKVHRFKIRLASSFRTGYTMVVDNRTRSKAQLCHRIAGSIMPLEGIVGWEDEVRRLRPRQDDLIHTPGWAGGPVPRSQRRLANAGV